MKPESLSKLFVKAAGFAGQNATLHVLEGLQTRLITFGELLGCSTTKSSGKDARGIEFLRKRRILFVFYVERLRASLPGVAVLTFDTKKFSPTVAVSLEELLSRLRTRSGISVPTDGGYTFSPVGFRSVDDGAEILKELASFFRDVLEVYGDACFAPKDAAQLKLADARRSSGSNPEEPPAGVDPVVWRQICERRGQPGFRKKLLAAYENRCAVTRCSVEAALEAAHLTPYSQEADYRVTNGIMLRADIHTLFDLHLIAIDPATLKVRLHPSLREAYGGLEGTPIHLPKAAMQRPDSDRLRWHFERWLQVQGLVNKVQPVGSHL